MFDLLRHKSQLELITAEQLLPYQNIVPFIDIVPTFVLFIQRLHNQIKLVQPNHLLFLSREGKILKQLFDIYAEANSSNLEVKTHYFQVSRRSTWLMSLPNADYDGFSNYFKQYFHSSLLDFVKSLTLDEYAGKFAKELDININEFDKKSENLYQQNIFKKLLELPYFQEIFYKEQTLRSNDFKLYLQSVIGTDASNELYVVDVGWKGSIQDNIFRWLTKTHLDAKISGYYLGLNQTGFVHTNNHKKNLVFSCVGAAKTPGFEVFNECKALYEIYLPAGHGAALAYHKTEGNNEVNVIYDDYPDEQMIAHNVLPFTYSFIELFENLVKIFKKVDYVDEDLYQLALRYHCRIVFNPQKFECDWIDLIYHSENFGVFQASWLGRKNVAQNFFKRLIFTVSIIRKASISRLGYWPYLTLYYHSFYGLHLLYKWIRFFQAKLSRR